MNKQLTTVEDIALDVIVGFVMRTGKLVFSISELSPEIEKRITSNAVEPYKTVRDRFWKMVRAGYIKRVGYGHYEFIKTKNPKVNAKTLLKNRDALISRDEEALMDIMLEVLIEMVMKTGENLFRSRDLVAPMQKRRPDWNPKSHRRTVRDLVWKAKKKEAGFIKVPKNGYVSFIKTRDGKIHIDDVLKNYEEAHLVSNSLLLDGLTDAEKKSIAKKERFPVGVLPWQDLAGNPIPPEEMKKMVAIVYRFKCDQFEDRLHMLYIGSKVGNYDGYGGSGQRWRKKLREYWEKTGNVPIIERTLLSEHATKEETWDAEEAELERVDAAGSDEYANSTNKVNRRNDSKSGKKSATERGQKQDVMLVIPVPVDFKPEIETKSESDVETPTPTELAGIETAILLFIRSKERPVLEDEIGGMLFDQGYLKEVENRTPKVLGQIAVVIMRNDGNFVETSEGFIDNASRDDGLEEDLTEMTKHLQTSIEGLVADPASLKEVLH